jgi:hypothetical protein
VWEVVEVDGQVSLETQYYDKLAELANLEAEVAEAAEAVRLAAEIKAKAAAA